MLIIIKEGSKNFWGVWLQMNSLPNVEYVFSVFEIILFFVFLLTNNPYKNTMSHSIIKTNCPLYWPSKCTHSQSQSPYLSESSKLFGFKTQRNLIKCLIISTAPARIVEDGHLGFRKPFAYMAQFGGFLESELGDPKPFFSAICSKTACSPLLPWRARGKLTSESHNRDREIVLEDKKSHSGHTISKQTNKTF